MLTSWLKNNRVLLGVGCILLSGLFSGVVRAEDEAAPEGEEGVAPPPAIYLPVKPAFVVNYGGAGRLKYLKAEVSLRLADTEAANSARHHLPYIRNNLVMLFASQTEEDVSSRDGREKLRNDALLEVRKVLEQEEGMDGEKVVDVFFNNFIVQN